LTGATAASVVAGVHSLGNTTAAAEPQAAHTTLTPLTPLKRAPKGKSASTLSQDGTDGLPPTATSRQQRESKLSSLNRNSHKSSTLKNGLYGTAPTSPSSSVSSASAAAGRLAAQNNDFGVGSIGGTALGPPGSATVGGSLIGSSSSVGNQFGGQSGGLSFGNGSGAGSGALGGQPIGASELNTSSSSLGGEIFTGQLPPRSDSAVGSNNDKWNSAAPSDRGSGLFGSNGSLSIGGGDIWGGEQGGGAPMSSGRAPGVIGGSSGNRDGGFAAGGSFNTNSGSSALASMLGINLPTGTGSLRQSSTLWNGPGSSQAPGSARSGGAAPGVIGSVNRAPGGGMAMGGSTGLRSTGSLPAGGNNNDIALLQSLLPGVHITSGNAKQPAAPGASAGAGGWNPMGGAPIGQPISNSSGGFGLGVPAPQGESWGGAPVGSSGRVAEDRQQEQNQSGIW
jgi:hypothetical protein